MIYIQGDAVVIKTFKTIDEQIDILTNSAIISSALPALVDFALTAASELGIELNLSEDTVWKNLYDGDRIIAEGELYKIVKNIITN